uniref:Claudin n=1 Tax=Leptobrachium leishanense TaxID=445787 RepID=A0A8C5MJH7_9ANUR
MANELNLLVIICGVFTMASTIASLWTDCWQVNSKGSVMLSIRCKGLWRECVWDRFVKIWTCDAFNSYLNPHPSSIVLTRALIITSSITSALAFLLLIFGLRSFDCHQDEFVKLQCLRISSALTFLVGMSSSAGVIRYCVYVYHVHQYEVSLKIPGFPGFEYGYSLWMAAGGSLGAFITAITACYLSLYKKIPLGKQIKEINGNKCSKATKTYV